MREGVDNLNESSLGHPLEIVAKGRGYEVRREFPLPRTPGSKGDSKRIDFLMVNRASKSIVALETKYKRAGLRMAGGIGLDAARLHGLNTSMIDEQIAAGHGGRITGSVDGFDLIRAVLVVWHRTAIMEQMLEEPPLIKGQFVSLVKAMLPDGVEANSRNYSEAMLGAIATKPVARRIGSLRAGSTVTRHRFWVASLMHRAEWARL